jgi:hypothetical protein
MGSKAAYRWFGVSESCHATRAARAARSTVIVRGTRAFNPRHATLTELAQNTYMYSLC